MPAATDATNPLDQATLLIRIAWGAAILSGLLTLGVTLYAMRAPGFMGFTAWGLLDVGLIFALAYGIYRRSRLCALAMVVYFVASKLLLASSIGADAIGPAAIVFLVFYAMGVVGTVRWHALNKTPAAPVADGA